MIRLNRSPIEKIKFYDHEFLIKRDDLLHKDFSGNKARKFHYFLQNEFDGIDTIVGHGSNQSNAMYSLSVLAKLKGLKFIYYTDHIPSYLLEKPSGNYRYALQNGMDVRVGTYDSDEIKNVQKNELFINEGGALKEAMYGLQILADEIKEYCEENSINKCKVFLPSGTGTTALFLQKFLNFEVLTCACVGDSKYLTKQFYELEADQSLHPTILETQKKYHFGKLYKENYIIWQELKDQTGVEFDLLYDPIGWNTLLKYQVLNDYRIIYVHQGGLIGNETMVERYKYKWNLSEIII